MKKNSLIENQMSNFSLMKWDLLDVLVYSIAVYFYESKYKQQVKTYSETTHQNI